MVDKLDRVVRNKCVWAWLGCQDANEDSLQVSKIDLRDYFFKAAFNFLQSYNSITWWGERGRSRDVCRWRRRLYRWWKWCVIGSRSRLGAQWRRSWVRVYSTIQWIELALQRNFGGRGSSVGRARDSWWGGPGFDSRCGRPLPTGWVGVSIMWPGESEVMVSQPCLMCGST